MINYDNSVKKAIREKIEDNETKIQFLINEYEVKRDEVGKKIAEMKFYEMARAQGISCSDEYMNAVIAVEEAKKEHEKMQRDNNAEIDCLKRKNSIWQKVLYAEK